MLHDSLHLYMKLLAGIDGKKQCSSMFITNDWMNYSPGLQNQRNFMRSDSVNIRPGRGCCPEMLWFTAFFQCFLRFAMSAWWPTGWRNFFPKHKAPNRREAAGAIRQASSLQARGSASTPLRIWGPARVKPSRTTAEADPQAARRSTPSDGSQ